MAIVKMKKIRLFASRSQKDELLRELMLLGCVEVSEPDELLDSPDVAAVAVRESAELDRYRSEHMSLARGLEIIGHYVPSKSKMFAPRPEITEHRILDERHTAECLELAKKLELLDSRLRRLSVEEGNEKNLIESLSPWSSLLLALNSEGTQTASVMFGAVPTSTNIDAFQSALWDVVPESQVFVVSSNRELHYVSIVCLREKQQFLSEVLRRFSFSLSPLKNLDGTAEDNIKEAETRLAAIANDKREFVAQITECAVHKDTLKLCFDHVGTKIARAEAADKLLGTASTVLLTGWMTAPSEKELESVLSKYACAWELVDPLPEETGKVPIALENNKLTRPLMMVTEMYSLPAYDGIDPNPLILPFFTIFFGIMYADIGYGLVLLALGFLGRKLIKARGMLDYAIGLLKMCGITTTVFGIIFGSFFGNLIPVFTDLVGIKHTELWALIDPFEQPMVMLVASLVIGCVHLIAGMAVNAYMLIRDGKWLDAIFDVGSWWLLFAGIALGALGVTWWFCVAGAAALVLTQGRSSPKLLGKIAKGIGSLYDITGYFGDILSYTRLMALMLAGGVIATVINVLGGMTGSVFFFIIIFFVGQAFNMAINIIGTYVHAARLQYLEFFGKFYKDGGRPFSPLKINTKYVDIIKEEK